MIKIANYQPEKRYKQKVIRLFKKIDIIDSSSKSHDIQFDESIKSSKTKIRKISTQQNNLNQKKLSTM